jgi:hypothetical protein
VRWTHRHGWRRHTFRMTAIAALVTFVLSAVPLRAANEPAPSNIDLLTIMTTEIVEELHGKFSPQVTQRPIELRPFGGGEDYVFVQNVFANVLTARGETTIALAAPSRPAPPATGAGSGANTGSNTGGNPFGASSTGVTNSGAAQNGMTQAPATQTSDDPGKLVLTFQNIAFGIAYPDVYRSHLVGGKHVKRRADVRVHATLTEGQTGRVLWVGEAARDREDEFDFDDSARVEQGLYQFSRPVLPGSSWGKIAEPVFVTGIIVGLIYLFFSNQSD